MKNLTLLRISNLVAIIVTLIMNGLSNNRSLFDNTVGDLGESRAVFFLPAGYVFAIWGVIYIFLLAFTLYQLRPIAAENGTIERVGWWFVISCAANVAWLLLFLFDRIWLSTVAMLVILASLIMIYQRLEVGQRAVDWQQNWAAHIPFSVYLGWISVATVANFAAALHDAEQVTSFLGIGADIWALVMMLVAGGLAATMLWLRRDIAYALVIVWALYGINARPFDTPAFAPLDGLNAGLVNTGALVIAIAVGLAVLARVGLQLRQRQAA